MKLAGLPIGYAGRATLGLGKRLGGRPAEVVAAEVQARTAEQPVQGARRAQGRGDEVRPGHVGLRGGPAREPGRSLPGDADPAAGVRPPLPARTVHTVLSHELGTRWRDRFQSFDDRPAAAASIGQVHRAVWADGRDVAVKVQYPGAGDALLSDLTQIGRMSRLVGLLVPGLDVKPLVAELKARVAEELDYALEASSQATFAAAFADDPDILVPAVVEGSDRVLVSEWVDGIPLSQVIARRQHRAARPGRSAARALPVLRSAAGRVAACRPAPRQLPAA